MPHPCTYWCDFNVWPDIGYHTGFFSFFHFHQPLTKRRLQMHRSSWHQRKHDSEGTRQTWNTCFLCQNIQVQADNAVFPLDKWRFQSKVIIHMIHAQTLVPKHNSFDYCVNIVINTIIIIIMSIFVISRALFHVKHAQLRWTGANTKIKNACI